MRISISEARRRLPALVRRIQRDPGARIEITVHNEPVAELRAVRPRPAPGEAVRKLLSLRKRLADAPRAERRNVSGRVKDHLYGPEGGAG